MHIDVTVRSLSLGLSLICLSLLAYQVLSPFLTSVAWAVILVYSTWPVFLRLKKLFGGHDTLSALIMTLLLAAVIVVPLIWIFFLLQKEIADFFRESLPHWLETKPPLPEFAKRIPFLGQELEQILQQFDNLQALLRERMLPWLQKYYGKVFSFIEDVGLIAVNLGIVLLTVFFLYRDGMGIMQQVRTVMQQALGTRLESYIGIAKEFVKAVIDGILLAAIAQAIMAGIGYWIAGLREAILLGALTFFFALVPFGTPLIWGTLSVWLLMQGDYWEGVFLAAWGTLAVSWIDNIVRPLVIVSATRIPFLFVFFGVVGGILSFGLLGLFIGPVILAIGLAVWQEWLQEINLHEKADK